MQPNFEIFLLFWWWGKNENILSEIYPPLQYGVPEQYLFEINDLKDMTNIPKVTRCIAMVGKMVRKVIFC